MEGIGKLHTDKCKEITNDWNLNSHYTRNIISGFRPFGFYCTVCARHDMSHFFINKRFHI